MKELYQMFATTGSAIDMSGSTELFGAGQMNQTSPLTNIGFDFYFDDMKYTQFTVNSAGLVTLDASAYSTYYSYNFPENVGSYPSLAAYFGRYFYPMPDGKIHYKLIGDAPRRTLVIEWLNMGRYGESAYVYGTYQMRLYEGSNKIEFWYGVMSSSTTSTSYSGTIGIAAGSNRWLNVYGNDFPEEVYEAPSSERYYSLASYPIAENTIYTFVPCKPKLVVTGNVGEGGTDEMGDGDSLLVGKEVMRGSSSVFRPFSLSNPENGCADVAYTMTLSGPGAADYACPTDGTILIGETFTPPISFTPQTFGEREAVLEIALSNGQSLAYALRGVGVTRIEWSGDVDQGGTENLRSGDQLLGNLEVNQGDRVDLIPFTILNINTDVSAPDAVIEYILDDPYSAYTLTLGSGQASPQGATFATLYDSLRGSEFSAPVLTFSPHANGSQYGTGVQRATLTIIADGERRVFTLNGFSVAAAVEFYLGGARVIESDRNIFRNVVSCVGEEVVSMELKVENTNRIDISVNSLEIFLMDGEVRQGTPSHPLETDDWGNLIPATDYIVTETAPGLPMSANTSLPLPLIVKPGESKTYYLTFIAQRPGKRYARAFLRTNAVNFLGREVYDFLPTATPGEKIKGLMNLEFYARGVGSTLAKTPEGSLDGLAIVFDPVKVGYSGDADVTLYNTGLCDLRISRRDIRIASGDVDNFTLTEVFSGIDLDGEGNYVIPAGGSATIKGRFTPSRSGSHRATVLLRTNDSTLYSNGLTERGAFYVNLYGRGIADLDAQDVLLAPAVIDGPGSEGTLRIENTSTAPVTIAGITRAGVDPDEIIEDPSRPWPIFPAVLPPGEVLELGLAFRPLPGSVPGLRQATVEIRYGNGDHRLVQVTGVAGTRLLTTSPSRLFDDVVVGVGEVVRRIAVLTNTGTLPLSLGDIRIEGSGGTDYSFSPLLRRVLDPGGSEFVEITYAPSLPGISEGRLVVGSNATNGDQVIALGATATGTRPVGDPTGNSLTTGNNGELFNAAYASAGVAEDRIASVGAGAVLWRSNPNPAGEQTEIRYSVPTQQQVDLALYNNRGELIQRLVAGVVEAGEHRLMLDVTSLSSGRYYYTLRTQREVLTLELTVVK